MHPLAAPGALWVLSRAGKVPRPPAGGRNLPQETDFLWKARERAFTFFFCFSEDFASAEATKGLSGRPLETFGAHPVEADGDHKKIDLLRKARERAFTFFFCFSEDFASAEATKGLSGRPLETFGAHPVEADGDHKKIDFLRKARERAFTFFFCFSGDFASAEATKGLSGRPLETFGAHPAEADGDRKKWISCGRQGKEPFLLFSVTQSFSPLRRRPGGFPVAPWTPSGPLSFEANGNHENVGFLC